MAHKVGRIEECQDVTCIRIPAGVLQEIVGEKWEEQLEHFDIGERRPSHSPESVGVFLKFNTMFKEVGRKGAIIVNTLTYDDENILIKAARQARVKQGPLTSKKDFIRWKLGNDWEEKLQGSGVRYEIKEKVEGEDHKVEINIDDVKELSALRKKNIAKFKTLEQERTR